MNILPHSSNDTGDLKNSVLKLVREAKRMKLEGTLDPDGLINGETKSHLPVLSQALNSYSLLLAKYLHSKGYELFGKTDSRFLEVVYRMLRDEFNYRPKLTRQQFLTDSAFIERKILFTLDLLKLCQSKHQDLQRLSIKVAKPTTKPKAIDKATRPIRMQTIKATQLDSADFLTSAQDEIFPIRPEPVVTTDRLLKASANSSLAPLFQHNIPVPSQLLPQFDNSHLTTPSDPVSVHDDEMLPSPTPRPTSFPTLDFLHDRELDVTPLQTPEKPSRTTKTGPTRDELKEGVRRIRFQLDPIPDISSEVSEIEDMLSDIAPEDPLPKCEDEKVAIATSTTGLFDSPLPEKVEKVEKPSKSFHAPSPNISNLVEQMSARLALLETRLKHVESTPIPPFSTSPPPQVSTSVPIPPSSSPTMTSSRIYNPHKYSDTDPIFQKLTGKLTTSKCCASTISPSPSLAISREHFSPPLSKRTFTNDSQLSRIESVLHKHNASSVSSLSDSLSTEISHLPPASPPTHEDEVLTVMFNLRKRAERARDMLETANSNRKRLRYKC